MYYSLNQYEKCSLPVGFLRRRLRLCNRRLRFQGHRLRLYNRNLQFDIAKGQINK